MAATLAAVCALGSATADAGQARRPYRIGVLNEAWAPNHPTVEGLKAGLKELGLEEGRDVTFDLRFTAGNREILPAKATELVGQSVDLVFTSGDAAIQAAYNASETVPIVFTQVGDALIHRLPQIGHNVKGIITGVSSLNIKLAPKRLEFLKTLAPGLRRVWIVYPAGDASALAAVKEAEGAAARLKLQVVGRPVFTAEDVVRALNDTSSGDALLAPDNDTLDIPAAILERSLRSRLPAVFPTALWVEHGGLVSYGPEYYAQGVQAARLVAKILRGARPQDLPVESADKIDLAVNLKTAAFLGLTVPRKVLLRADRLQR
jgi:putative ABC transport system substrate-binding protein